MSTYYRVLTTAAYNAKLDVKILSEAFCGLHEWSPAIHRLKVIVVLPRCSSTALNDPVPIIHVEHGGNLGLTASLSDQTRDQITVALSCLSLEFEIRLSVEFCSDNPFKRCSFVAARPTSY